MDRSTLLDRISCGHVPQIELAKEYINSLTRNELLLFKNM